MHGSVKVQGALRGLFNGKASHYARNRPDFDFSLFIFLKNFSFFQKSLTTRLPKTYKCHHDDFVYFEDK